MKKTFEEFIYKYYSNKYRTNPYQIKNGRYCFKQTVERFHTEVEDFPEVAFKINQELSNPEIDVLHYYRSSVFINKTSPDYALTEAVLFKYKGNEYIADIAFTFAGNMYSFSVLNYTNNEPYFEENFVEIEEILIEHSTRRLMIVTGVLSDITASFYKNKSW